MEDKLKKIKIFIFDIDGVLSSQMVHLSADGTPLRSTNVRDGYAIHTAIKCGYNIAIISGGYSEASRIRLEALGVKLIYMKISSKIDQFNKILQERGYSPEETVYVGDDIPDYHTMLAAGISVAPRDAVPEILSIASYVSPFDGGTGVARDIIEKTMKAQGTWLREETFVW